MGANPEVETEVGPSTRMPGYLIVWRMVMAGVAWWGLFAAIRGDVTHLRFFSHVSTLTVALAATASVLGFAIVTERWQRAMAWCRGASTSYAIVTALIFQTLLGGAMGSTSSVLEHAVVPAVAVIDWLVFGPGRVRQAWWTALTWLILPFCYLGVYYNVRDRKGEPMYSFMDPDASNFWRWVGIMLVVFTVVGFTVWAAGVLRSAARRWIQIG